LLLGCLLRAYPEWTSASYWEPNDELFEIAEDRRCGLNHIVTTVRASMSAAAKVHQNGSLFCGN